MPDDKNKRDSRDRNRVSGSEDYELSCLEEKLGVSREQVLEAIASIGNNREKVEAYLSSKK